MGVDSFTRSRPVRGRDCRIRSVFTRPNCLEVFSVSHSLDSRTIHLRCNFEVVAETKEEHSRASCHSLRRRSSVACNAGCWNVALPDVGEGRGARCDHSRRGTIRSRCTRVDHVCCFRLDYCSNRAIHKRSYEGRANQICNLDRDYRAFYSGLAVHDGERCCVASRAPVNPTQAYGRYLVSKFLPLSPSSACH